MLKLSARDWSRLQLLDPEIRERALKDLEAGGGAAPSVSRPSKRDPAQAARLSSNPVPGGGEVHRDGSGRVVGVDFWFHVRPVPKERPRVVKTRSGKISTYTPRRTKALSDALKPVVLSLIEPVDVFDTPLSMHMHFLFSPPDSWPVWKRELASQGGLFPTSRPDLDNLEKALLDVFNGWVFADDSLVVSRSATKIHFQETGILVSLRRCVNPSAQSVRRRESGFVPVSPLILSGLGLELDHRPLPELVERFLSFVESSAL